MTINIGTYRDVIHFGNIVKVDDGMGGYTESFTEVCSARGRAIPSASVTNIGDGERNKLIFRFESRFASGIYPDMAVKINDDPDCWTITEVIDPSGKRERLEFTAEKEFKR